MDRVFSRLTVRAVSEDKRIVEGIASTPRPDREQDIVEPMGSQFILPIPFLLDHNHLSAIGEVEAAEVTEKGIVFRAHVKKIAEPGPVQDLCDKGWSLLKNGLRKYVSIGFRPTMMQPRNDGGFHFLKWEWLELSACTVPCNPDAAITALRSRPGQVVKLPPPTLYDIAKDFLPQYRTLSDADKAKVKLMRAEILRGMDRKIARQRLGIHTTRVVRL